jgi:hypothetical protein
MWGINIASLPIVPCSGQSQLNELLARAGIGGWKVDGYLASAGMPTPERVKRGEAPVG